MNMYLSGMLSRAACVSAAGVLAALCGVAHAQPASYFDAGDIAAPATPLSEGEYVQLPVDLFNFGFGGQGEFLTVKWIKFHVAAPIEGDLYLDIDSRIYSIVQPFGDLFMAIYDSSGNLIATDDTDGSFPEGLSAGLSFGSSGFRSPPDTPVLAGQDGAVLPAGDYWFALVAGNSSTVTANATNWDVTTTQGYQLGFFGPGEYYLELSFAVGNTTPLPPPSNDNCDTPLVIGENTATAFAWSGTNAGATYDGPSRCYQLFNPPTNPKDIWFSYVPSATGIVEVIASGGNGGAATPILTQYNGGCGSGTAQCTGNASIGFDEAVRLSFPVVQGQPVLLALAVRAGQVGPMDLSVRLVPPPCVLNIPADAVPESEMSCGEANNNGCEQSFTSFDPLVLGQAVHGTLFSTRTLRDVDWFKFTLEQRSDVTLTFAGQYALTAAIVNPPADPGACLSLNALFLENNDFADLCTVKSGSVELEPGEYTVAIGHSYFDGLGCGSGYEQYWLRVSATPIGGGCLADVASDSSDQVRTPSGTVGPEDIEAFVNAFITENASVADVASDSSDTAYTPNGSVGSEDLEAFVNGYFAGC